MKFRRMISVSAVLMTVLLMEIAATGCQQISYGTFINSQEELEKAMADASLDFQYPGYLGEAAENSECQYVAVNDTEQNAYSGYKIYHFGSPFYVSVTAYDGESDALMSDEESRTEYLQELQSDRGTITVYSGKGHEDALYLIGCVNIGGDHYEIRVTNDEEMDEDSKYVHAIYADNEYYPAALDTIAKVAEHIQ